MFKKSMVFCCLSFLMACQPTYNASMKLEASRDNFKTLFGSLDPQGKNVALQAIAIDVTDGEISCKGASETDNWSFSGSMFRSKYRHTVPLVCSDGNEGKLILTVNWNGRDRNNPVTGQGIGKLNDGTKVKVILGETAASLNW